mmetsp:Transcript_19567/g.48974  ORF Transcript_19567/g.48974 Transcript_19567/m.48974 type:complete len:263 (+) Transcript_19567:1369-2157(+)
MGWCIISRGLANGGFKVAILPVVVTDNDNPWWITRSGQPVENDIHQVPPHAGVPGGRPPAAASHRPIVHRHGPQVQSKPVQALRAERVPDPPAENPVPHAPRHPRVPLQPVLQRGARGRPQAGQEDEASLALLASFSPVRFSRRARQGVSGQPRGVLGKRRRGDHGCGTGGDADPRLPGAAAVGHRGHLALQGAGQEPSQEVRRGAGGGEVADHRHQLHRRLPGPREGCVHFLGGARPGARQRPRIRGGRAAHQRGSDAGAG